jgi:cytochrome c oxidase subunit 5a
MSSTSLLRVAARAQPSNFFRSNALRSLKPRSSSALYAVPGFIVTSGSANSFSTSTRKFADKNEEEGAGTGHHEESFEEFTARSVMLQLGFHATAECI